MLVNYIAWSISIFLSWYVLFILILKYVSYHNVVYFFDIVISKNGPNMRCFNDFLFIYKYDSYLDRWLRTRRFSEPTFRPSGASNYWKKYNFSRFSYLFTYLYFLLIFSFLWSFFSYFFFNFLLIYRYYRNLIFYFFQ
jgi:hypothetical protein